MELLDIYNAAHEKTGRIIERDGKVLEGERLLLVHVCVFNSRGEMLIQRRSDNKDRYPGCWDVSAGGFVSSGEDSREAVMREAKEELGLEFDESQLKFLLTEPFSYVLDDFYIAFSDASAESLSFQKEEVSGLKWVGREEVFQMLSDGRFVDYDAELMKKIFDAI
ncbi:MAG: NUDIX domain-containing protein [Oscillospiraceae bacterium]|nr:NUDIX domain-containing protein [Oscillospiraceae bacterium]